MIHNSNQDVHNWGIKFLCRTNSWRSCTILNTASGLASLSAFSDMVTSSCCFGPNHWDTILAISFGDFENFPHPFSTTYGTFPASWNSQIFGRKRKKVSYRIDMILLCYTSDWQNRETAQLSRLHTPSVPYKLHSSICYLTGKIAKESSRIWRYSTSDVGCWEKEWNKNVTGVDFK